MKLLEEWATTFARGMNDSASPTEYQPDECALLVNARPSLDGATVARRGGSKRLHAAALNSGAQGYGGIEYRKADGTVQLIVAVGDKWYKSEDDGETFSAISGATGLTQDYWDFVIMRVGSSNLLIAANGSSSIYKWDGTTFGTLGGSPPSGVKRLAVFNDRLYVTGHAGIEIRASAVGNPELWTSASGGLTLKYATHDGDTTIQRLFSFGGLLLVWKRESFGYVEGFGVQTIQVQAGARGISRSVGMTAWRSLQPVGDAELCWMSERGLEYFRVGGQPVVISDTMRGFMDSIAWGTVISTPGIPTAGYRPSLREYRCAVPTRGTSQNAAEFVFRPPGPRTPAATWRYSPSIVGGYLLQVDGGTGYLDISSSGSFAVVNPATGYLEIDPSGGVRVSVDGSGYLDFVEPDHIAAAMFTADRPDEPARVFSVGYDGFVRLLDEGDADDVLSDGSGGADVVGELKTRPLLFEDPFRRKKPKRVLVSAEPMGSVATITVAAVVDGATASSKDLTVPITAGEPVTRSVRAGGKRGSALQAYLTFTDPVTIQAVAMLAEPIGGAY